MGTSKCDAYRIGTSPEGRHQNLWPSFQAALASLPDSYSASEDPSDTTPETDAKFLSFVEQFGTHIPTSVTMGGRATRIQVG